MNDVERALKALREASSGAGAPARLEGKLRRAFQSHHSRRRSKYAWLAGAIAASLMVGTAVRLSKPGAVKAPELPAAAAMPAAPIVRNEPKPAVARARPAGRRAQQRPPTQRDREVATDFFAIPYAPAMTQVDRGQLIRVRVPATSMRSFGLPVSEERMFDRVRADVLLGEDGIARAIRFVR